MPLYPLSAETFSPVPLDMPSEKGRLAKLERDRYLSKHRRKIAKKAPKLFSVPGTPSCEIRPAYWCNVCCRPLPSYKELLEHIQTPKHGFKLEKERQSGEAGKDFEDAAVTPNLGQPYGSDTAQFGYVEGRGFYCYPCGVDVGDGLGLDAHIADRMHLDTVAENDAD